MCTVFINSAPSEHSRRVAGHKHDLRCLCLRHFIACENGILAKSCEYTCHERMHVKSNWCRHLWTNSEMWVLFSRCIGWRRDADCWIVLCHCTGYKSSNRWSCWDEAREKSRQPFVRYKSSQVAGEFLRRGKLFRWVFDGRETSPKNVFVFQRNRFQGTL